MNFAAGRKGEAIGEREPVTAFTGDKEEGEEGDSRRESEMANVLWSKKSGECCPV